MLAGSEAFCFSVMDVTYVELPVSAGSKSEKRGWNFHGMKFLLKSVSYVRSTALVTILPDHVALLGGVLDPYVPFLALMSLNV